MLFNVSTLLGEPVGATRSFHVEDEQARVPAEQYSAAVSGSVEMLRSARGVMVRARLEVSVGQQCGRCLLTFEHRSTIEFDEEFVPERDPESGEPVEGLSPDDFRIDDEHRHLDLSEAVRQYERSALPLRALCRADCAGLCSTCGQDLNRSACGCERVESDGRWAGLATLGERLRMEEDDGRPQGQDAEGEAATPA